MQGEELLGQGTAAPSRTSWVSLLPPKSPTPQTHSSHHTRAL